jgi:transcriptional regulator with XRE-family HTH domain
LIYLSRRAIIENIGGETMETINDRIAQLINEKCEGNKSAFARRLNITPAYAAQLYSGAREPSDRTISDICREFGCDDVWLRTGVGEPFRQETRQELIMRFAVQTVKGSNEFRKALVAMLATLDDSEWDGLENLLDKMLEQYKKD